MVEQDWLRLYATPDGIDQTLKRMSRRPKRANPLAESGAQLALHAGGLDSDFADFFPAIIEHVTQQGISVRGQLIPQGVRL